MGAPISMTYPVNIVGGYDSTSTAGILQPVKINGKHTLSLGGPCLDCSDSKNWPGYKHIQTKIDY